MEIKDFFTDIQKRDIQLAIENAELNTSGEIRVHLAKNCKEDVLKKSKKVFEKLKMHQTDLRNGVLIFLAIEDRKISILGDKGINDLVEPDFWDSIKNNMVDQFKKEQFTVGLCQGIKMIGVKLKNHFPYQKDDVNELTNDISFE